MRFMYEYTENNRVSIGRLKLSTGVIIIRELLAMLTSNSKEGFGCSLAE